jgi:hypothetical protein
MMNAKQFFKELAKAEKAQAIVENFMKLVNEHFRDLDIYAVSVTYCKGDGFLLLDSRARGDVYPITQERIEKILSFKTEEEVYAFFDLLSKQGDGV